MTNETTPPGNGQAEDVEGASDAASAAQEAADAAAAAAEEAASTARGEDDDAPADAAPEERSAGELAEALAEAERRGQEYLDHLRRERAEFENYRKRTNKERMEALDKGAEQVVANLLSALDTFGYALEAADDSDDDQLAKGVRMVHAELIRVLSETGLEEVPGEGAVFDPNYHEAVGSEESEEALDEPVVTEVLRPGYRFKGRVLRPAAVKVRR